MKKTRAGVLGAGSWAVAAHIPTLAAREEVSLIGVCRHGEADLRRIQREFGFEMASQNYEEVLAQELDVVVVASPTAYHYEHAAAALRSGAHVLCEKPMTISSQEAWSLVDIAAENDRQLLMSFGWNYMPMIRAAKKLLGEYSIGDVEHVTVHMSSQTRELLLNTGAYPEAAPGTLPDPRTWTDPTLSGGGYGQAQLSHALGLLFRLFDLRAVGASALMSSPLGALVELHDAITLRFDQGAIGVLSGGSSHVGAWGNKHELEIRAIGSEGQFIIDLHRELVWLYRADGVDRVLDLAEDAGTYLGSGPANALADVGLGICEANDAPGEVGARTVETLELAYRSAASGKFEERALAES